MSISQTGFGPYVFERPLASDASGTVYLARKEGDPLPVALWLFRPELGADASVVKAFEADLNLVYGLNHRSIVQLVEHGNEQGQLWMATEYLEGRSLQEQIDARQLPKWNESCRLAVQVLDTLQYVHDQGTAHGDFKASHVLIDKDRQVVLTGFAVARLLKPGAVLDAASDTYSMAQTLYEMLTGIRPEPSATAPTIPRPEVLNRQLPSALGDVLLKALGPDIFERPSAGVLARQIKQVLFSEEAEPTVKADANADIEQVTALLCALPSSDESKSKLGSFFRGTEAYSFQWLPEGALVLYRSVPAALESAKAALEQFPDDNLSMMLATGSLAVNPVFAMRRPQLGEYACEPVEKVTELLAECPPGAVRVDAATAEAAPEGMWFREVSAGISELAPLEPTVEAEILPALVPEPTPAPPRVPISLEERAMLQRARESATMAPPAAMRGLMGTVMVPPPPPETPLWKRLLPWFLLVLAGVGAYFVWERWSGAPTALALNTVPKKVKIVVDKGPAQNYTAGTPLALKPGKHVIKVTASGFQPYQATITLQEGQTREVTVKLKKARKKS